MSGYIVLIIFVVFVIIVFSAFLFGLIKGKKAERQFWEEAEARKAQDAVKYQREKQKVMQEVFGNAEQKKAELHVGTTAERFNRINDSLRGRADTTD